MPSFSFGQHSLVAVVTTSLDYEIIRSDGYLTIDLGTDTAESIDGKEVKIIFKNISDQSIMYCPRLTCYADGIFPRTYRQKGYRDNLLLRPNESGKIEIQIRLGRRYGYSRKSGGLLFYSVDNKKSEALKLIIKARIIPPVKKVYPNRNNSMIKH
jgi:hypothetical protein